MTSQHVDEFADIAAAMFAWLHAAFQVPLVIEIKTGRRLIVLKKSGRRIGFDTELTAADDLGTKDAWEVRRLPWLRLSA